MQLFAHVFSSQNISFEAKFIAWHVAYIKKKFLAKIRIDC